MWNEYQMFVRKILAWKSTPGIDCRYPDQNWTCWRGVTFKARSEKEAMKKAEKFLRNGDIRVASMMVREIPEYV